MPFKPSSKFEIFCHPRVLLSGTQRLQASEQRHWIPACAGTTKNNFSFHNHKQHFSTKTQGDTP